jgi:cell wall-associated NlpC family hydrolase
MKQWLTGIFLLGCTACLISCDAGEKADTEEITTGIEHDISLPDTMHTKKEVAILPDSAKIQVNNQSPENIVSFAKTLIGVPYKYASTDPKEGFDCSGFITYVFNHFDIKVPRSSIDFTNVGTPVDPQLARSGDLILFTGTDTLETHVGHMGIVTENTDSLRFIHSTSGRKYGVTITSLNEFYQKRFVKVIRIF